MNTSRTPVIRWRGALRAAAVILLASAVVMMHAELPAVAGPSAGGHPSGHTMMMPSAGASGATAGAARVKVERPLHPPQQPFGHTAQGMCLSAVPRPAATGLTGWHVCGTVLIAATPAAAGSSRAPVSGGCRCRPPPDLLALGVLRV